MLNDLNNLIGDVVQYIFNKIFLIATMVFISGCATPNYVKSLREEDWFYKVESFKEATLDEIIGKESIKSGFIGFDRNAFEKKNKTYQLKSFDERALDKMLSSLSFGAKLNQVLNYSVVAEINALQSTQETLSEKLLKNSGTDAVGNSAIAGAASGALLGAGQISQINNQISSSGLVLSKTGESVVMNNAMLNGLLAGAVAGAIHQANAESTFKNIISENSFEGRMEAATSASSHLMPSAWSLAPNWSFSNRLNTNYGGYAIKRNFIIQAGITKDLRQQYLLVGALGFYRGEEFEAKFSSTLGWDYVITHLNAIELLPNMTSIVGGIWLPKEPEAFFRAIKAEIDKRKLIL